MTSVLECIETNFKKLQLQFFTILLVCNVRSSFTSYNIYFLKKNKKKTNKHTNKNVGPIQLRLHLLMEYFQLLSSEDPLKSNESTGKKYNFLKTRNQSSLSHFNDIEHFHYHFSMFHYHHLQ